MLVLRLMTIMNNDNCGNKFMAARHENAHYCRQDKINIEQNEKPVNC